MFDRRGITLAEVVVSMALIGGLLVSVTMAVSLSQQQLQKSRLRADAIGELERLLVNLETKRLSLSATEGTIPQDDRFQWWTTPVPGSHNRTFGIRVIRMSIGLKGGGTPRSELAGVELVVPDDSLLIKNDEE
jgi:type II secretory pathway component PulJ